MLVYNIIIVNIVSSFELEKFRHGNKFRDLWHQSFSRIYFEQDRMREDGTRIQPYLHFSDCTSN